MKLTIKICVSVVIAMLISACGPKEVEPKAELVRGLKTQVVAAKQNSEIRRYPSVLQPSESTSLSFQISGQLGENKLTVGQTVSVGEVLVELDKTALSFEAQEAKAALDEAKAAEKNARRELQRNKELKQKGLIGQAALDDSETNVSTLTARTTQAANRLAVAQDNLVKAKLIAPYDGIINSVQVDSYDAISAGMTVANLYNPSRFEARFSVSYVVASRLSVGSAVSVEIVGLSGVSIAGTVTELAASTDAVASFPVVVRLNDSHPELKAGMAVQVSIEFAVTEKEGYLIPFSAVLVDGTTTSVSEIDPRASFPATVFLFNEAERTVFKKTVMLAGVRDNQLIVSEGLSPGDRVAVAGVAFLREGQKVKLLNAQ